MDVKVLALAKKYTDDTMAGTGSIQGKNCTITDITHDTANKVNKVTFSWTENDGTVKTQVMSVPDGIKGADGTNGTNGLYVKSAIINSSKHLILTLSDDTTTIDAGLIPEQTVDLSGYVQKETGKGLSETNVTATMVSNWNKAEQNVQSNWTQTDSTKDDYIQNKPTIPTVDSAISATSVNAVENKVVKAELDKKVDVAQGVANKDKFLKVGADGNVTLGDVPSGTDIVTAWETTTSDAKVPSEKLVKDNLDTITQELAKKVDIAQGVINKGKALTVGEDGNVTCGTVATDSLTIVDKTQAEYNALTDAEKNDATKLYNITDADDLDLTSYAKQSDVDAINNNLAWKNGTITAQTNSNYSITENISNLEYNGFMAHLVLTFNCNTPYTSGSMIIGKVSKPPKTQQRVYVPTLPNSGNAVQVLIATDGNISCYYGTANNTYLLNITYPIG